MSLGSDLWVLNLMSVRPSLSPRLSADLTDMTLADSNSIPTDDVNRAILGNGAIWWPKLKLMQVAPFGD